jgi:branched-chain amino acid transport system substrate-binding protein
MRDQGVKAVMISGDGITTDEFATIGGPGVEGTLMTFPPDPQKRPEAAAVIKKFAAKNFKPEAYTLYSYAAVQIMAEGAKRANSVDPKKVAAALRGSAPVKTVIGDIAFDKKGDITRPDYTMYTWKKGADGKITYVEN